MFTKGTLAALLCITLLLDGIQVLEASELDLMREAVNTACDFSPETGHLRIKRQSAANNSEVCEPRIKSCGKTLGSKSDDPSCGDIMNATLCIKEVVFSDFTSCEGNVRQMYLASFVRGFLSVTCQEGSNNSSQDLGSGRKALMSKVGKACSVKYLQKVLEMKASEKDQDVCCGNLAFLHCLVETDPTLIPQSAQSDFINTSYDVFRSTMPGCDTVSQKTCGNEV